MASVEGLMRAYERFVGGEWVKSVAPQERVWFALYEPRDERRLRLRLGAFEEVTIRAGHSWRACDLTDEFARWMAAQEYRESYFESPEDLTEDLLDDFAEELAESVRSVLDLPEADEGSVVAVYGVGSLFGLARVSLLLEKVALIPISARRQLNDLSDEMATKLTVLYYSDAREALIKALGEF